MMCWPPPWHTWMLLCKEDLEGWRQAAVFSASGMLAAGLAQGLVLCRVGGGSKFCSTQSHQGPVCLSILCSSHLRVRPTVMNEIISSLWAAGEVLWAIRCPLMRRH